jgi:hypothetical protein
VKRVILVMAVVAFGLSAGSAEPLFTPMFGDEVAQRRPLSRSAGQLRTSLTRPSRRAATAGPKSAPALGPANPNVIGAPAAPNRAEPIATGRMPKTPTFR